jgi:hypothetical protein
MCEDGAIVDIKDIIELATLLVLTWTLVEIARTRRIDSLQKDLQLLPALMFYIRGEDDSARLWIRNIGFGAAITVNIMTTKFMVGNEEHEYRFRLKDTNNTLIADEEREVKVSFFKNGSHDRNYHRHLDQFMAYFNPENLYSVNAAGEAGIVNDIETPSQRELTVRFKDITGQQYDTTLLFSEDGISVAQTPRRLKNVSLLFRLRSKLASVIRP